MQTKVFRPTITAGAVLLSVVLSSASPASAGCPTPSFAAELRSTTGELPFTELVSVAVGDFNADGKLDLVIADHFSFTDNVSVLLGRGDGTFRASSKLTAGSGPRFITVGDFNGDGDTDVVVANEGRFKFDDTTVDWIGSVSVFLGNGDGTFKAATNYREVPVPREYVAVGDFNGDGKVDIAVEGSSVYHSVSFLFGNGDGTFQPFVPYPIGFGSAVLTPGDFNSDGKTDLVFLTGGTVIEDGAVAVILGNGDGTFQNAVSCRVGKAPNFVAVGDFNQDGKPDLAVSSWNSTNVFVLLGNGDGTFQRAVGHEAASTTGNIVAADFNADGKLDLAFVGFESVSILQGIGDGTLEGPFRYPLARQPTTLAVGDFNGDGKPDLAAATEAANSITILLNTCTSGSAALATLRANNTATFSWPLPMTGFVLESTMKLSASNWQAAVEMPTTNNGRLEVIVPVDRRERYFRLRKP